MTALRSLLAPVGLVCGPVVAGLATACARLLNGARLRPLGAAERAELSRDYNEAELASVRVAERCWLPLLPGFVAITLGREVYVRGSLDALPPGLLAHELVHVRQFQRMGWLRMTAEYGRLWVTHGYLRHPMEVEARKGAR